MAPIHSDLTMERHEGTHCWFSNSIGLAIWLFISFLFQMGTLDSGFAEPLKKGDLFGRWAHASNVGICDADPDSVEQPFTIQEMQIVGLENWCKVFSWSHKGPFLVAKTKCDGEGYASDEEYYFALSTDSQLIVADSDGVVVMSKCKPEAPKGRTTGECPLSRTVFVDTQSGALFVVRRVAVAIDYFCEAENKWHEGYTRPSPDLEDRCEGPFGSLFLEGSIDGANFVIERGRFRKSVPYEAWRSFDKEQFESSTAIREWLVEEKDIEAVKLGRDGEFVMDSLYPEAAGPLMDRAFYAYLCRE